MRTTLILDDDLVAEAMKLTGVEEKTKLLHMGLEALIQRASSRRLAALGGSHPNYVVVPRSKRQEDLMIAEDPKPYGAR